VCDLETSRMGAPYIYDISRLRVKYAIYKANLSRQKSFPESNMHLPHKNIHPTLMKIAKSCRSLRLYEIECKDTKYLIARNNLEGENKK